ncbi:MAG: response regulator [Methanotrichaceae archaeon]|nr:response regulator [Methanotrichaceae archaeon]
MPGFARIRAVNAGCSYLSSQRGKLKDVYTYRFYTYRYRADAVANGQQALEALERQHYDVILMDVKMPVMNGLEATKVIRERWPENGPKIVALTAYALPGDDWDCHKFEIDIRNFFDKQNLGHVFIKADIINNRSRIWLMIT